MNRLITEVFIPIFLQLPIKDKLECIVVCKRWYNIITENVLYKNLNFSNIDNFNKAVDLFDKKEHFGNYVESLTLKNCEIDTFSIFFMPQQFPKVKNLIWEEDIESPEERMKNDESIKNLPPPYVYHRALKRWNQFQSIDIVLERLPFITMLLESSSLRNLTYLRTSFLQYHVDKYFGTETLSKLRPIVKSLINNIKNAPSLETLDITCSVLDLDDMEQLHFSAPKLKSVNLYCTAISGGSTSHMLIGTDGKTLLGGNGIPIAQNIANTILDFSIKVFTTTDISGIHNVERDLKDTIKKWLIYIGCKYNGATNIELQGWSTFYLPEISDFKEPMLTIIRNMRNITEYHAFFYPITKSIMDAMRDREDVLETLHLYTHKLNSIVLQLKHVELSRQAKTIRNLNINSDLMTLKESAGLDSILSAVSHQHFQSLINLKITCIIQHNALVIMIQSLPFLETLSLDSINFNANENIPLVPIIDSKIRSLHLTFGHTTDSTMDHLNYVLDFILQSCSLLTNFTLNGKMQVSYTSLLKLWFFDHKELKKITINIPGVQYYTFSWINRKQGLQWADYDELAEKNDLTGKKFHIDIAWRNENVELDLAKAPV